MTATAAFEAAVRRRRDAGRASSLGERDGGEGATTSGAPGPSSWVSDVGAILRFALPALGSSLASPVLSAVDTAVVGQCATTLELAALGPASTVFDSLGLVFAFLQVASINKLAGLAGGEGETAAERRREAVSEFAALSVVLGVVLMLGLLLFAGPLMAATTNAASSEAIAPAALYTRVRALSVPAFIAQITAQGILMGLSRDSVSPLLAVLLGGALNTAGDLVLVGWLRWGIAGAAAATVAAQCATSAFLALRVAAELGRGGEGGRKRSIKLPVLVDLAPLVVESLPFLAMKLLTCVKVFLMNYLSTMFGSASLAAHLVALTIWRCLILVGEPLSFAAQSFAPQHFARQGGEGRGLYYVKLVLGIGAGVSVAMLAATLTAYAPLTRLFTYDPATLSAARSVSAQVALSVCVFPVLLSLEGSLLAIGRVRDLVLAMASNVAFMLLGWWVLHVKGGESLKGVWTVFSGMHSFYAAVMLAMVAGTLMAARGSRLEKP